jgi:hypothetical protein
MQMENTWNLLRLHYGGSMFWRADVRSSRSRPTRRADNLAAICVPNKFWEPQPLATLRATTVCTGITLLLPYPGIFLIMV